MYNKFILFILLTMILFSSCGTTKHDLSYFQDLKGSDSGVLSTNFYTTKIEPENQLVIIVKSEVPEATAEFNLSYLNPAAAGTTDVTSQPQLQTYKVDNKGDIDFPRLGTIHVAGMTTYELKDYLTERIGEYVKDPTVTVNLQGYRIVVMGEVNNPQTIVTSADRYSVLDALAQAGDLNEYALRDNILILRRNSDDQMEYHRINLHSSKITESPYFWLKNNDVILVSPNKVKEDNSKYNQRNAYKLSVISTITGMSTAVISLIIALAIK